MKKPFILYAMIIALSISGCAGSSETESSQEKGSTISVSEDENQEAIKAYNMGISYFDKGDYDNASEELSKVRYGTDKYDEAMEKLKEIYEIKQQAYLKDAQESADNGNYKSAIDTLNTALLYANSDEEKSIEDKINEYENLWYRRYIESAESDAGNGHYISAIDTLNNALQVYPNSAEIKEKLSEYKQLAFAEIKAHADGKEYDEAILKLVELKNAFPNDSEVKKHYDGNYSKYIDGILKESESINKKKGYQKAIQYLNGIKNTVSDEKINNKIDYYYGFEPVYLSDFEIYDYGYSGELKVNETIIDNFESEYSTSMYPTGGGWSGDYVSKEDDFYATYYIKSQYKTFSGTFAVAYENRNEDRKVRAEIYADDVKVFTSDTFKSMSKPQRFSIDVSNVDFIKIKWVCVDDDGARTRTATLFDARLTEN